ncbi:unannotated protein [freshwater metagenome]|uniref:Unannotated protein n=1 Tax=freshwater metagenome TaxID=449393 RepID=A0A6J7DE87_9ZZZZ|nr:FkbM family methyltransferase [Actinomycetota bacterium]
MPTNSSITRIQRGVRHRISRIIAPRSSEELARSRAYYPQQESCQIPYLWFLFSRFLGERESGTFVEVGAYDGTFVSNTWGLAERGWNGFMLEPVPYLAERCRANHSTHPHIEVIESAIGAPGTDSITLKLAGTLTTGNADVFAEYSTIDWASDALTTSQVVVPCQTLNDFLDSRSIVEGFEVLVVDVEGLETEVFAGFDLSKWRPRLLIIELADTHPDLSTTAGKDAQLGLHILDSGYHIVFKDCINTVFVRRDVWMEAVAQA